jgi:hypothetical protein
VTTLQTHNEMAAAEFDALLMSDRWQSPEADPEQQSERRERK